MNVLFDCLIVTKYNYGNHLSKERVERTPIITKHNNLNWHLLVSYCRWKFWVATYRND